MNPFSIRSKQDEKESCLTLNKKISYTDHSQENQCFIKTLQSVALLYHPSLQKYKN
jgi:hypothetical protein